MSGHVGSLKAYFGIFGILMLGTVVTVAAAVHNFGPLNAPIALTIATGKAICVILVFMHVKDSDRLTKLTVVSGIFWLGILLTLTMSDYLTRVWH